MAESTGPADPAPRPGSPRAQCWIKAEFRRQLREPREGRKSDVLRPRLRTHLTSSQNRVTICLHTQENPATTASLTASMIPEGLTFTTKRSWRTKRKNLRDSFWLGVATQVALRRGVDDGTR